MIKQHHSEYQHQACFICFQSLEKPPILPYHTDVNVPENENCYTVVPSCPQNHQVHSICLHGAYNIDGPWEQGTCPRCTYLTHATRHMQVSVNSLTTRFIRDRQNWDRIHQSKHTLITDLEHSRTVALQELHTIEKHISTHKVSSYPGYNDTINRAERARRILLETNQYKQERESKTYNDVIYTKDACDTLDMAVDWGCSEYEASHGVINADIESLNVTYESVSSKVRELVDLNQDVCIKLTSVERSVSNTRTQRREVQSEIEQIKDRIACVWSTMLSS
jgi:hypothetical protein